MRLFAAILWALIAVFLFAFPVFADGRDWLIAKPEPAKAVPARESEWVLDQDGSYVRQIPGWTAPKATASTTAKASTQSVPAVTQTFFRQSSTTPTIFATNAAGYSYIFPALTPTERIGTSAYVGMSGFTNGCSSGG